MGSSRRAMVEMETKCRKRLFGQEIDVEARFCCGRNSIK